MNGLHLLMSSLGLLHIAVFGGVALWLFLAGSSRRARLAAVGFAVMGAGVLVAWALSVGLGQLPIDGDSMVVGYLGVAIASTVCDLVGLALVAFALTRRAEARVVPAAAADPVGHWPSER